MQKGSKGAGCFCVLCFYSLSNDFSQNLRVLWHVQVVKTSWGRVTELQVVNRLVQNLPICIEPKLKTAHGLGSVHQLNLLVLVNDEVHPSFRRRYVESPCACRSRPKGHRLPSSSSSASSCETRTACS